MIMTKRSGLNTRFYVGGYDLSGDTQTLRTVASPVALLDVTDITESAFERLPGLRSGEMGWSSFFNSDAGRAHPVLSALPTTDVVMTYGVGTTLGDPAASMVAKQIGYDGARPTDGSLLFSVDGQSTAGRSLVWGVQLTAGLRTDTAPTNGTGVDLTTVSTAFGWLAHLHVTAVTGTSVTVSLEDSDDDITYAALAGGASFTAATGVGAQQLASATSISVVRQYVRAVTTGTFNPATFVVNFTRYDNTAAF
jgi:hypothetical protein